MQRMRAQMRWIMIEKDPVLCRFNERLVLVVDEWSLMGTQFCWCCSDLGMIDSHDDQVTYCIRPQGSSRARRKRVMPETRIFPLASR